MSNHVHLIIRDVRSAAGLSQAELARRAGVTRSVMNVYEHGRREPSAEMFARILNAAGFDLAAVPKSPPTDPERAGRILEMVIGLAEELPYQPKPQIPSPPLTETLATRNAAHRESVAA